MADLRQIDSDELLEIIQELFDIEIKGYSPDDEHYYYGVVVDGGIDEEQGGAECIEDVLDDSQQQQLNEYLASRGLVYP
jgi:hypothetical protein